MGDEPIIRHEAARLLSSVREQDLAGPRTHHAKPRLTMRVLRWLDDHAHAIQGWTLALLFALMVAVLIFGPHVGLASEDVRPVGCHEVRC